MLRNLSLRYAVPLNLSLAILLTGLVVAAALLWRAYDEVRSELFRTSVELSRAMSNTLTAALRHKDTWRAYQEVRSAGAGAGMTDRTIIVLDDADRVFVSSEPTRFPILSRLAPHGPELARLEAALRAHASFEPMAHEVDGDGHLYVVTPLAADGVLVGTLVMAYPRSVFGPRLRAIASGVGVSTLVVLAALVPVGWYLGKRMVAPLVDLSGCMNQVGRVPLEQMDCARFSGTDEIAQLGQQFALMVHELEHKQALERQMVVSERLAALGRLAAGVAHEINNPLGGMMNAISTFRRFGCRDPVADKTISLLERGLEQIRETVSALLVEARAESHPLTHQDVEDVYTLVQADAQKKALTLAWHNGLCDPLPLPATPIRQVLLNLSLNAVHAAAQGGRVGFRIGCVFDQLDIEVHNDGEGIPEEHMGRLFEPLVHRRPDGTGLGLWVTYQIVQQLHGEILVQSEAGHTRFTVRVPLVDAA